MSMFWCAKCDNLRDSDDGCQEYGPKGTELICADCMDEEEEDLFLSSKTDMSYDGILNKLLEMGCPSDIAHELAREKSR